MKRISLLMLLALGRLYKTAGRRWVLEYGATKSEAGSVLPGDELIHDRDGLSNRAISVNAPADKIWPWIVQIGPAPRGGVYSFRLPRLVDKIGILPMEPASLVMERKMLLGMKQRAERTASKSESGPAFGYSGRHGLAVTFALLLVVPKRFTIRSGGSKRALLRSYRRLFGWDVQDRLKAVNAKTLVICGTKDRANLSAARELAAAIPEAELKLIPGAGHLWIGGRAKEFNEILSAFVQPSRSL